MTYDLDDRIEQLQSEMATLTHISGNPELGDALDQTPMWIARKAGEIEQKNEEVFTLIYNAMNRTQGDDRSLVMLHGLGILYELLEQRGIACYVSEEAADNVRKRMIESDNYVDSLQAKFQQDPRNKKSEDAPSEERIRESALSFMYRFKILHAPTEEGVTYLSAAMAMYDMFEEQRRLNPLN